MLLVDFMIGILPDKAKDRQVHLQKKHQHKALVSLVERTLLLREVVVKEKHLELIEEQVTRLQEEQDRK